MIDERLRSFAYQRGLAIKHDYVYGVCDGYTMLLEVGFGMYDLTFEAEADPMQVAQFIDDNSLREQYGIMRHVFGNGTFTFSFSMVDSSLEQIDRVCAFFTSLLNRIGAKNRPTRCKKCGNDVQFMPAKHYIENGALTYMDDNCARMLGDTSKNKAKSGSILLGIVGATLGAIIGAVPWAIVYSLGFVSMWLGILVGICSAYGYSKLGGKNIQWLKGLIVIICTIVIVIFVNYITVFMVVSNEIPGLTYSQFLELLEIDKLGGGEVSRAMTADTVKSMLFCAGGLIIYYFGERKKNKAQKMNVSNFVCLDD